MKVNELIGYLTKIRDEHGDLPIDMIAETEYQQIDQEVDGVVVAPGTDAFGVMHAERIKLVPKGF